jgi:hypothetical protein
MRVAIALAIGVGDLGQAARVRPRPVSRIPSRWTHPETIRYQRRA